MLSIKVFLLFKIQGQKVLKSETKPITAKCFDGHNLLFLNASSHPNPLFSFPRMKCVLHTLEVGVGRGGRAGSAQGSPSHPPAPGDADCTRTWPRHPCFIQGVDQPWMNSSPSGMLLLLHRVHGSSCQPSCTDPVGTGNSRGSACMLRVLSSAGQIPALHKALDTMPAAAPSRIAQPSTHECA